MTNKKMKKIISYIEKKEEDTLKIKLSVTVPIWLTVSIVLLCYIVFG